jgi:hypothetical protein
MALEIKYTPPIYSSLHGDLIYTVADADKVSDPTTYTNFKFIGDIYIGGNLIARVKRVPDPVTGIGIFNVAAIVRAYVATIFNPTPGILIAQALTENEFYVNVDMHFGEEWDYTPTYNILGDTPRSFVNSYNGRFVGATSLLAAKNQKVASNRPTTGFAFLTTNFLFVPYFQYTAGAVPFSVTPSGGGSGFSTSFTPTVVDMNLLNVSPITLNALHAGCITPATTSYAVTIGSQTYVIKLICEPIYQPYMIHFLNQYGGFDSKIFSKVSRKILQIERKDYGRLPYTVDSDGQVSYSSSNGVFNEERSTYSSLWKETMSLNSDILMDEEYIWLQDLLLSPMIYLEDGGYFYPIVITDTNYEPKKVINDDLTNLVINIEFGKQLNAQFR